MSRLDDFKANLDKATIKRRESAEVKALKKVLAEYKTRLAGILEPHVTFVDRKRRKLNPRGSFLRVVFNDVHGSKCDQRALNAFYSDLEILKPRELMCLGDLIDCGGFLAQHHTMGYVEETGYSYEDDIHMGNLFLDRVIPLCDEMDYLMGNHERRPEKYAVTESLKIPTDRAWYRKELLKVIDVSELLSLEARGIRYIRQGETVDGEFVPATLKKGKSLYTHTGSERGSSNPKKMLNLFHTNVAFAHTHKAVWETIREAGTGRTLVARNYGCLCKLQPLWRNSDPTGWTHGYGLEVIGSDGSFWAIPVPIVDGKSMLSHFTHILNI